MVNNMKQIDIIKKILDDNNLQNPQYLVEKTNDVNMSIPITHIERYDVLLYKFDDGKFINISNRGQGLNRMCDYFLFVQDNDKFYTFLLELKGTESAVPQLKAGKDLLEYIIKCAKRIGYKLDILDNNIRMFKIKDPNNKRKKSIKPI